MRHRYVTSSRVTQRYREFLRVVFALLAVLIVLPANALAISAADQHAIIYGTPFYDETPTTACSAGSTGPLNFPAETMSALKPVLADIAKKQSFYEKYLKGTGVPWQFVAALEYRESDNNIDTSVDPQNGETITGYPWTNKDGNGPFANYDEIWSKGVVGQIKHNSYGVKIAPNGVLSNDDAAKIATSWRYGEKLVWKPGSNIPKDTTYLNNTYVYSGMAADFAINSKQIIHWSDKANGVSVPSYFYLDGQKDDRLGMLPVYLSLMGGGTGNTGTGCLGGTGDTCTGLATPPINDKAGLVAAFNKFEEKRTGGKSPLKPYFGDMIDGAIAAGWNPMLVLTQAQMESQLATDKSVYGLRVYNAWGRTASSSQPGIISPGGRKWYAWTSWTDALKTSPDNFSVYNVRKWITEAHFTTIDQYIMQYAPPSDGNDTTGYIQNIKTWINEIAGYAGAAITCGGGPGGGAFTGFRSPESSKLVGHDTILPQYGFTLNAPGGNNMTFYAQADSRWGTPLGYNISNGGCGPTNMAMIVSTLTKKSVTPTMMVPIQNKFGGLTFPDGTQNGDSVFVKIASYYGLKGTYIGTDLNKARETIKAGGLVIASTFGNDVWSTGGHYITIRGITADNRFLVANSNGRKEEALVRSYSDSDFSFNAGMTAVLP